MIGKKYFISSFSSELSVSRKLRESVFCLISKTLVYKFFKEISKKERNSFISFPAYLSFSWKFKNQLSTLLFCLFNFKFISSICFILNLSILFVLSTNMQILANAKILNLNTILLFTQMRVGIDSLSLSLSFAHSHWFCHL